MQPFTPLGPFPDEGILHPDAGTNVAGAGVPWHPLAHRVPYCAIGPREPQALGFGTIPARQQARKRGKFNALGVNLMFALVAQYTLWGKECISRESSPGHIDGNDVFYH